MPATFNFIEKINTSASTITFSSIPSIYSDLIILGNAKTNVGSSRDDLYMRFNGATSQYKAQSIVGYGSTITYQSDSTSTSGSFNISSALAGSDSSMSGSYSQIWIYIPGYSQTTFNKSTFWKCGYANGTGVTANGGANSGGGIVYSLASSAINSITLFTQSGYNFSSGTNFVLYGIKKS